MLVAFQYGRKNLMDWCDARNVVANIRQPTFLAVITGVTHFAYREHAPFFADKLYNAPYVVFDDE